VTIEAERNHTSSNKVIGFCWWLERIVASFSGVMWSTKEHSVIENTPISEILQQLFP